MNLSRMNLVVMSCALLACLSAGPSAATRPSRDGWTFEAGWLLPDERFTIEHSAREGRHRLELRQITERSEDGTPIFKTVRQLAVGKLKDTDGIVPGTFCQETPDRNDLVLMIRSRNDRPHSVVRGWVVDTERGEFTPSRKTPKTCSLVDEGDDSWR